MLTHVQKRVRSPAMGANVRSLWAKAFDPRASFRAHAIFLRFGDVKGHTDTSDHAIFRRSICRRAALQRRRRHGGYLAASTARCCDANVGDCGHRWTIDCANRRWCLGREHAYRRLEMD
jgi:hypothetical protein